MIKYRFNVGEALERMGINMYKAKKTKIISQGLMQKLKKEDTNITLETINRLCIILDMQPKDIIMYEEDAKEKETVLNELKNT